MQRAWFFGVRAAQEAEGSLSRSFLAMALVADLQSGKEEGQQL